MPISYSKKIGAASESLDPRTMDIKPPVKSSHHDVLRALDLTDEQMLGPEKKRVAGLRLKAARMALGYDQRRVRNQTSFYAMFDRTIGRANNWERGVSYPDPEFLVALEERFDIGPDWIICGRPGGLPARISEQIIDNFNQLITQR